MSSLMDEAEEMADEEATSKKVEELKDAVQEIQSGLQGLQESFQNLQGDVQSLQNEVGQSEEMTREFRQLREKISLNQEMMDHYENLKEAAADEVQELANHRQEAASLASVAETAKMRAESLSKLIITGTVVGVLIGMICMGILSWGVPKTTRWMRLTDKEERKVEESNLMKKNLTEEEYETYQKFLNGVRDQE